MFLVDRDVLGSARHVEGGAVFHALGAGGVTGDREGKRGADAHAFFTKGATSRVNERFDFNHGLHTRDHDDRKSGWGQCLGTGQR